MEKRTAGFVGIAVLTAWASGAAAQAPSTSRVLSGVEGSGQAYPVKPVRIIVAQAAGAQSDLFARLLGQKLTESMGQPVIADPRPGAGGMVGAELGARAAPDGYTLLMATNSTHGSNPALYSKLPYDPIKDFAPITLTLVTPYLLTTHPSLPVTNLKQLIAFAKARPGQLNYASAGNGSTHHLCGELLKTSAGIDLIHVPYKGGPPATAAVLSGEMAMHFSTVPALHGHIKSGRMRAMGVTAQKRSGMLPDVPTMAEAGLPGFEMSSWFALLAPVGTPRPVINRLNTEVLKVLSAPDVRSSITSQGAEIMAGTPEQLAEHIKSEIARIGKIARTANIKAE